RSAGQTAPELRLRGRLRIGEQQKRHRLTANRRAVASPVSATQSQMPQDPLRTPCARPELTRTPTPRTSWKSALSPLCRVPRPLRSCRHPRTPPHLEPRALASGRSGKASCRNGDDRADIACLCSVLLAPRCPPLEPQLFSSVRRRRRRVRGAEVRDHDAPRPGAANPAALAGGVCGLIRRPERAAGSRACHDYGNCAGLDPVHLGGAGTADEWWSTIFQPLPSFT